jgi:hypothetical protein
LSNEGSACSCGQKLRSDQLSCPACGKKYTIDRNLTGYHIPEPPVAEWARELSNTQSPSKESLEEVKDEFKRRNQRKRKPNKSKKKRSINPNAKSFIALTVIAAIVAIVFPFLSSISNPQFDVNFNEGNNKFKFLDRSENNAPMYFEGCGDISYEVRTNYSSPRDLELIEYSLDEISKVYGRNFVFKGTTDSFVAEDINSNILINFTSANESQELKEAKLNNGPDIAGLGGPFAPKLTSKPISRSWAWTKGFVLIERSYWLNYDEFQKVNLVIHEIGHVLGLDHPANLMGQIMGYGDDISVELGSGDKLGLQALSALAGCREMPEF